MALFVFLLSNVKNGDISGAWMLNIWEVQRSNFRVISFSKSCKCYLIYTFYKVFGAVFDVNQVLKPSSAHKPHISWLQVYFYKYKWIKSVSL